MIGLIVLALLCGGVSAGSHSLRYFYTSMTPIPGLPEFVAVGYVDDALFVHYDSDRKQAIPRQRWMEDIEDNQYWERNTQNMQGSEQIGKVNIQTLITRTNLTGGIHTFQQMYGCELRDDGSTAGFIQFGWDGKDFISFDKEHLVWNTPVTWGVVTKNKWNQNRAGLQQYKGYLEGICIEWLKKYQTAGERELKPVVPVVSFTRPGNSNRLSCVATGFYPHAIEVTLWRDGKALDYTQSSEILPNHDGTYQINRWAEIDPEDQAKFSCEVEHSGLKEKVVVFYVREAGSLVPVIIGVVLGIVVLIALAVVAVVIYKKKAEKKSGYNPTKTSDKGESSSNSSATA